MTKASALRLGLWGSGNMAAKHAESAVSDGRCTLVAIAARNKEAAQTIQKQHGAADCHIYSSPEEMLAATSLDALICAIPPGLQNGQVAEAAKKGIHLFLEKPVALNIDEVKRIAAAANTAHIKTQVCHHFRCDPAIIKLRHDIQSGKTGKVCHYQARFWMNGDMSAWWKDPALGGGQVIEQLIHHYDMALYLCGSAERVSGFWTTLVKNQDPSYQVDDNSVCNIAFSNGALGHISGSNTAAKDRWISDWRIIFENLVFDSSSDGDWRTPDKADFQWLADNGRISESIARDSDPHKDCMIDWLDAIANDGNCVSPIEDAIATHALVFAAAASMRENGQLIELSAKQASTHA